MQFAIFNGFPFHYEMFGYVINYCRDNQHKLVIYTNESNNCGWINFYKDLFAGYHFDIKATEPFEKERSIYDIVFLLTDDDPYFKNEWIDNN